jgi:hypothetical protein
LVSDLIEREVVDATVRKEGLRARVGESGSGGSVMRNDRPTEDRWGKEPAVGDETVALREADLRAVLRRWGGPGFRMAVGLTPTETARCPRERHGDEGSVEFTGDVRESTSSRKEKVRESTGLGASGSVGMRRRVRVRRLGVEGTLVGESDSDSDKRPEVKRREYWWNGISAFGESVGVVLGWGDAWRVEYINTKAGYQQRTRSTQRA